MRFRETWMSSELCTAVRKKYFLGRWGRIGGVFFFETEMEGGLAGVSGCGGGSGSGSESGSGKDWGRGESGEVR